MKKTLLFLPLIALLAIACNEINDDEKTSIPVATIELSASSSIISTIDDWSDPVPVLKVVLTPNDADPALTWTSNKPEVLSVDKDGKLALLKKENADVKITAKSANGIEGSIMLKVIKYGVIDATTELGMKLLDRNLGATEAYVYVKDTPSPVGSIGYYYQWGKNTPVALGGDAAVNENYAKEWNATGADFKDWSIATNTPCPTGWTIPNQAQMKTITDKAWADYDGMTGQTDEEFEAAKALHAKLLIAEGGAWRIQGADVAARTAATPDNYLPKAGFWWSSELNARENEVTSARKFKNAYTMSNNNDIMLGRKGNENEVNVAMPIRCVKVVN